jgi:hypothetical protein
VSGRRIHPDCNKARIQQQRSTPLHCKRTHTDESHLNEPELFQLSESLLQLHSSSSALSSSTSSFTQSIPSEDEKGLAVAQPQPSISEQPNPTATPLNLAPAIAWEQYGYALLRFTNDSKELAQLMLEMKLPKKLEQIAGQVAQYDLSKHKLFTDSSLSFKWRKCVLDSVKAMNTDLFTTLALLHLITPKLLVASPKVGLQTIHWDHINGYESPQDNISVILYCVNTKSTAMPRFPKGTITKDPTSAQYLERRWYHSIDVEAGDILIFQQRTPHYGVTNDSEDKERVAFFGMFSQHLNPNQDLYQMFKWSFMAEVFGNDSKEYAQTLVEEKEQNPVARFKGKALQQAKQCLLKHGMTEAYGTV